MKVYDNNKIKTYRSLFELTNSNVLVGRKDGLTIGIDENTIQELRDTIDTNNSLKYEVDRLNNIINELEKDIIREENKNNEALKNKYKMGNYLSERAEETIGIENDIYDYVLTRLQELKEGK